MGYWNDVDKAEQHMFQPVQWRTALDETVEAAKYFARMGSGEEPFTPPLGSLRWENAIMGGGVYKDIVVDGQALFMWVWNNSGSDIGVGVPMVRRADTSVTVVTGDVNYLTCTGLTANNEYGALIQILDDAGAAGAAPEGSWAKVIKNIATRIDFQPDVAAALAVGDTAQLIYDSHVLAAGSGAKLCDFRGVPVASAGIPNGYMGWACIQAQAVKCLCVAAGTAITTHEGLIAATALFTNGSTSAQEVTLAYALSSLTTDTVSRYLMCALNPNFAYAASA